MGYHCTPSKIAKNPKHLQNQMLERICSKRNSQALMIEMSNGITTLEDIWAVFWKLRNKGLLYNPATATLRYSWNELKTWRIEMSTWKPAINVYSRFTIKIGSNQAVLLNRWMEKHAVVYSCHGILFSDIKKWTIEPQKAMKEP